MPTLTLSRPILTLSKAAQPAPAEVAPEPTWVAREPGIVHRRAAPEVVAENQRLEALWHAKRDAERAAAEAADAEMEALLRDLAPKAFADPPSPLAIGIYGPLAELLDGEFDGAAIARFLRLWTRRPAYLRAVAAGEMRLDLDGHPTVAPEQSHRNGAIDMLARMGPSV
jgi:hypothetical protein